MRRRHDQVRNRIGHRTLDLLVVVFVFLQRTSVSSIMLDTTTTTAFRLESTRDVEDLVIGSNSAWLVAVSRPGRCADAFERESEEWRKTASVLRGVVLLGEASGDSVRSFLKVEGKECPTIVYVPRGAKSPRAGSAYPSSSIDSVRLAKFVVSKLPDTVGLIERIADDTAEQFFAPPPKTAFGWAARAARRPKVLLFTKKGGMLRLYRLLAIQYGADLTFAVVAAHKQRGVVKAFGVTSLPTLLVASSAHDGDPKDNKAKMTVSVFQGNVRIEYDALNDFLRPWVQRSRHILAETTNELSSHRPERLRLVRQQCVRACVLVRVMRGRDNGAAALSALRAAIAGVVDMSSHESRFDPIETSVLWFHPGRVDDNTIDDLFDDLFTSSNDIDEKRIEIISLDVDRCMGAWQSIKGSKLTSATIERFLSDTGGVGSLVLPHRRSRSITSFCARHSTRDL